MDARRQVLTVALGAVMTLAVLPAAQGQARIPEEFTNLEVLPDDIDRRELIGIMRNMTSEVGAGRCAYCHTVSPGLDQPDDDFAADDKVTKRKAREMLKMVQAINAEYLPSLPERDTPALDVACVTCHSGKTRPATLAQEVRWALEEGGAEALRARYLDLRREFYGRGAYDFGPASLESVARSIGRENPGAALTALALNLEYHPESVASWLLKGQIHTIEGDTVAAVDAFERSLEIVPGNPVATQQLEQLRGGR